MARESKLTAKRKEQIIELLSMGATDKDTCAAVGISETAFYQWLKDGKERKSALKIEFLESVTRARAQANLVAIESVRLGMLPSQISVDATETIKETRLNKNGQPYTYEKTVSRRQLTKQPGDWKAGIEFLKRRDPDHWSEKIVVSLSPEDLEAVRVLGYQTPSEAIKDFIGIIHEAAKKAATAP